ncbi:RNA-binding protein [candidate division WOR-3 bacterium JGI_Cruoil_03_51_56]|uniref:RNA-binding protein n=1 Tax=candidate division WOR-3 bacterium JGI_Cruoil_03_51_56 TaxID=1973747 RepID=A0A235BNR4_UNCW3|nr:MAG: RNA-binding protein [candidate division WOR-3 bacterium JGI_Cruoil_03_51_56]
MGKRVFIGNLPFDATEDQLRELFSKHGEVASVNIIKDKYTDRSRGFAFVEMATDEAAATAVSALSGYKMGERTLTINEARPRTEGNPRRGGGGGRGYSGNRW